MYQSVVRVVFRASRPARRLPSDEIFPNFNKVIMRFLLAHAKTVRSGEKFHKKPVSLVVILAHGLHSGHVPEWCTWCLESPRAKRSMRFVAEKTSPNFGKVLNSDTLPRARCTA